MSISVDVFFIIRMSISVDIFFVMTGHPATEDVLHAHHAFREIRGTDVESCQGDISHKLVEGQAIVQVVAVDVQMSHESCQGQGHTTRHVQEPGLVGDVGVSVWREGSEPILALKTKGEKR